MSLSNSVKRVQVIVSTIFLVDEYTSSVKRRKENRAITFEKPAAMFVSFQGTAADRINKLHNCGAMTSDIKMLTKQLC